MRTVYNVGKAVFFYLINKFPISVQNVSSKSILKSFKITKKLCDKNSKSYSKRFIDHLRRTPVVIMKM